MSIDNWYALLHCCGVTKQRIGPKHRSFRYLFLVSSRFAETRFAESWKSTHYV